MARRLAMVNTFFRGSSPPGWRSPALSSHHPRKTPVLHAKTWHGEGHEPTIRFTNAILVPWLMEDTHKSGQEELRLR
jgi:hypothetical protein